MASLASFGAQAAKTSVATSYPPAFSNSFIHLEVEYSQPYQIPTGLKPPYQLDSWRTLGDKDLEWGTSGSVIGSLLFLLFVNDLPSVINVTKLRFADDVKVVSPRSQRDLLLGSLYNVWHLSVNWTLPINPTKFNYIAIEGVHPLQLSLDTGSLGDSIQVANVVKDLGVLMDNSFPASIHCKEAASKARRMLFMIRRFSVVAPFITRWFAPPPFSTLCRPARQTLLPTPIVWSKSSKSFKRQLDSTWEDLFAQPRNLPSL